MTNGQRIITIPRHDPVDARTMAGVVRDAGLTEEEFRALLDVSRWSDRMAELIDAGTRCRAVY